MAPDPEGERKIIKIRRRTSNIGKLFSINCVYSFRKIIIININDKICIAYLDVRSHAHDWRKTVTLILY